MSTTIGKLFDLTVKKYPNKEALFDVRRNRRYTYKEWSENVNQLANALIKEGVRKGDRVSTYLFNNEEIATAVFACAKIGAVINPINFRLMSEEVAYILDDAKPKVVLFEQALASTITSIENRYPHISFWFIDDQTPSYAANYQEKIKTEPATLEDYHIEESDIYAIMYTSGTTGRPKGVIHRHREIVEQSLIIISATKLHANDHGLVTAPMFHCAELHCALIPRIHVGARNTILHQFNASQVLQLIEQEKITKFFAAPTMWNMLLQEDLKKYKLDSLALGLYGAAPMAPTLVRACHEKLGISLVQAYGMTEMGPAISFLLENDQLTKAGSAGQACLNHDIRIVKPNEHGPSDPDDIVPIGETGEIIVQGPCMMSGYFERDEATENALYKGWYHSGDIGYLDEDGYLWVKDRVDDMIISGGENIYPREVEDVLYEHSGVLDVAVIGSPNEHWGETVIAFVVKKDPNVTEADLDEWCKNSDHLANFKRPRKYIFCDVLPRNASGKIQKFLLREELNEKSQNI
ncbi:fatty acid--CoA ligase [Heyndrickxia sporothermodurans]|uniref:Fatty acid--CoA ligase n=1 Tax=Heyndrickxia sporothermodurans TaxID=46224 RepID=A0A150LEA0_9BACI|nr:fatty acid--CoA ligase [Heyndrickxia sporothermodurans]KYD10677.1 Long-chain-fatty-acid--CoA ligase [Heyndrickxia sporothermodurans]MBL5767244.1 fatty acid--CoA ligase [Heyndrickxia sporothermodurans]MBL5770779.1 fatty acid--CoA ligase [Heyndrickxia sporothermodurans]MBL5774410.1 fatty acid--CoA ligase [Heyndrickxia sporothermodurans]MBL5777957.1 fatty acid--CoA ligase [Heyndrickxia sporothermodurans]